jgi:RNA polymerase sigma factor (sigma-70 family)
MVTFPSFASIVICTVNTNDNSLMEQVSAGKTGQLAVLFERHHRALFRYFVCMQRDRQMAEDLVQEVFFRILRYRASYNASQSFTGWMYQIARNAGVDQTRKRREVVDIDEFADRRPEFASKQPGPEEAVVRQQDLGLLRRAMDKLPPEKREILVLSRFQGMRHDEIAAVLGCEVGTVKVRVYRALRALEQLYVGLEREKVS